VATKVLAYPTDDEGDDDSSPTVSSSDEDNSGGVGDDEVPFFNRTSSEDIEQPLIDEEPLVQPDAPQIPEEVLSFEALQDLVYEFTNFTSAGFNSAEAITRLDSLEQNLQRSIQKFEGELQKERQKLNQLTSLSLKVRELKAKLGDLQRQLSNLASGNLGEMPYEYTSGSGSGRQTAWATLYRSRGHGGRSTELDFRTCLAFEDCCKNLSDLDNDSQSIHTHDTCVRMYKDRDCGGESREFYPGSPASHQDFGSYNDVFSSGKPCSTRA